MVVYYSHRLVFSVGGVYFKVMTFDPFSSEEKTEQSSFLLCEIPIGVNIVYFGIFRSSLKSMLILLDLAAIKP